MAREGGTRVLHNLALWLSVIGAINWGLVGFFNWDLVRAIFGHDPATDASPIARVVYAVVGLAGVALALLAPARAARLAGTGRYAEAGGRP